MHMRRANRSRIIIHFLSKSYSNRPEIIKVLSLNSKILGDLLNIAFLFLFSIFFLPNCFKENI